MTVEVWLWLLSGILAGGLIAALWEVRALHLKLMRPMLRERRDQFGFEPLGIARS